MKRYICLVIPSSIRRTNQPSKYLLNHRSMHSAIDPSIKQSIQPSLHPARHPSNQPSLSAIFLRAIASLLSSHPANQSSMEPVIHPSSPSSFQPQLKQSITTTSHPFDHLSSHLFSHLSCLHASISPSPV